MINCHGSLINTSNVIITGTTGGLQLGASTAGGAQLGAGLKLGTGMMMVLMLS